MNQGTTKTQGKPPQKTKPQRYRPLTFWHDLKEDFDELFNRPLPDSVEEFGLWHEDFKRKAWDLMNQAVHASFKNGRISRQR